MKNKERPNFTIGTVDVVPLRIKNQNDSQYIKLIRDKIRVLLANEHFFKNTPFTWITFIHRYGTENKLKPELGRISKKYGDLPVTVEIASDWIEYSSFNDEVMLEQILESTTLIALIYVGEKYGLPINALRQRLNEIGGFPELPEDYYEKLPPNVHRIPKDKLPQFQDD